MSEATITSTSSDTLTDISQEVVTIGESVTTEREVVTQTDPISSFTERRNQNPMALISLSKDNNLNIIHDNNLENNEIPKVANQNDYGLSEEEANRLEDEKHMQNKILHNEYARLGNIGNFENIFSQPADHFVPPLVMAKARISDDMTVLSLQEKHAQLLAEQQYYHKSKYDDLNSKPFTTEKPSIVTTLALTTKDVKKYSSAKKYSEKYAESKIKNIKGLDKSMKVADKSATVIPTMIVKIENVSRISRTKTEREPSEIIEDPAIDLSIILHESTITKNPALLPNLSTDETTYTTTHSSEKVNRDHADIKPASNIVTETQTESTNRITNDVIKITILDEVNPSAIPITIDVTTKVPVTDTIRLANAMELSTTKGNSTIEVMTKSHSLDTEATPKTVEVITSTQSEVILTTVKQDSNSTINVKETGTVINANSSHMRENDATMALLSNTFVNNITTPITITTNGGTMLSTTQKPDESTGENADVTEDSIDDKLEDIHEGYDTSTQMGDSIDDLDSPLLSAANEPLRRPNRSRRPQQPANRNKFYPFRMLG